MARNGPGLVDLEIRRRLGISLTRLKKIPSVLTHREGLSGVVVLPKNLFRRYQLHGQFNGIRPQLSAPRGVAIG